MPSKDYYKIWKIFFVDGLICGLIEGIPFCYKKYLLIQYK